MGTARSSAESTTDGYVVRELVHNGVASTVYRIDYRGERLILKKYSAKFTSDLEQEREILSHLRHKNIISLVPLVIKNSLVLEYHGHSLRDLLRASKNTEGTCMPLFRQVLSGVEFLHGRSIVHCDLKPENILFHNGTAKITDFGSARQTGAASVHVSSTNAYSSLELLLGVDRIDGSVDMWALGCVLYELLTGRPLFTGESAFSVIGQILEALGCPLRSDYKGLRIEHLDFLDVFRGIPALVCVHPDRHVDSFVREFFVFDPRRRITAAAALERR